MQKTNMDSTLPFVQPWNGTDKCFPRFICIVCSMYQCSSSRTKHIGTFRWTNFSINFMCNRLLDRMLMRHLKISMHWWTMGYGVWSSLLQQKCSVVSTMASL